MDKQAQLNQMIAQKPVSYPKNPYWQFNHDTGKIETSSQLPLSVQWDGFQTLIQSALKYFREIYQLNQTEAQVLILTQSDYEKLTIPVLALNESVDLSAVGMGNPNEKLRIVILPQINTLTNTIVSEALWNQQIVNQKIWPIMRIHSHHQFHAYQSLTDWSSLNSGTLEMVLGCINNDQIEIAYWLDTYGGTTKNTVFKTVDNGQVVKYIDNGKRRGPTKFKAKYSNHI